MTKILAVIVCAAVFFSGISCNPWTPSPREDQNWYTRHEGFVNFTIANRANISVLFYGDSITDAWRSTGLTTFNQYYAPLGAANYGIGGDRTEHVLWRLLDREIEGLNPKVTVIKIGTNNMGSNSDNDIAAGTLSCVRALKQRMPNTKILLLGVLPRTNAQWNARVRNINVALASADNGNDIRFLDMFTTFCEGDDGFNMNYYTADLLHLQAGGYVAWAQAMNPLFFQMYNATASV